MRPLRLMLVAIAAFALLVAACGSASDKVAEKLAEELIEASSDGEVDIDVSGDGDDVSFKVETDEGSFTMGSGGDLPDGLEIPAPDGGDVMTTMAAEDGIMAMLSYEGNRYDEITGFYDDWTASAGGDWDRQSFNMESDGETARTTMWVLDSGDQSVNVADCGEMVEGEGNAVCVTLIQGM